MATTIESPEDLYDIPHLFDNQLNLRMECMFCQNIPSDNDKVWLSCCGLGKPERGRQVCASCLAQKIQEHCANSGCVYVYCTLCDNVNDVYFGRYHIEAYGITSIAVGETINARGFYPAGEELEDKDMEGQEGEGQEADEQEWEEGEEDDEDEDTGIVDVTDALSEIDIDA